MRTLLKLLAGAIFLAVCGVALGAVAGFPKVGGPLGCESLDWWQRKCFGYRWKSDETFTPTHICVGFPYGETICVDHDPGFGAGGPTQVKCPSPLPICKNP